MFPPEAIFSLKPIYMPQAKPNDLEQLEQTGRLLLPLFREAVQEDLERFKQELFRELRANQGNMDNRVRALEANRWKMTGAIAVLAAIWVAIAEFIRSKLGN